MINRQIFIEVLTNLMRIEHGLTQPPIAATDKEDGYDTKIQSFSA